MFARRLTVIKKVLQAVNSESGRFCHSRPQITLFTDMKIQLLPALEDNYMYLLIDEETKQCAAVDPVEPEKVLKAVDDAGVALTSVLTTHHHWDHAGGNEKFIDLTKKKGLDVKVFGGDDRIGALSNKVKHGDKFKIGSLDIECLFTPCHTSGHICYYVTSSKGDQPAVFTGDTLFMGGFLFPPFGHAIRLAMGYPDLPRVFCGHEYTVNNLKFAAHVEPSSDEVKKKLAWATTQRSKGLTTIPSTIEDELKFNPFMRVKESNVQAHVGKTDAVETMGALRAEKDNFRG
ncbi:gloB [Mytilus coruscus]|uniref:hydroxyacylglutathione hydrolase n=1 Tax=Mytilus coruscus TaxID=42192 RepID=A0A6J8CA96_MYTCO|nr:gloB [Mytilus coruscus]